MKLIGCDPITVAEGVKAMSKSGILDEIAANHISRDTVQRLADNLKVMSFGHIARERITYEPLLIPITMDENNRSEYCNAANTILRWIDNKTTIGDILNEMYGRHMPFWDIWLRKIIWRHNDYDDIRKKPAPISYALTARKADQCDY
jgi:hypothetical protein